MVEQHTYWHQSAQDKDILLREEGVSQHPRTRSCSRWQRIGSVLFVGSAGALAVALTRSAPAKKIGSTVRLYDAYAGAYAGAAAYQDPGYGYGYGVQTADPAYGANPYAAPAQPQPAVDYYGQGVAAQYGQAAPAAAAAAYAPYQAPAAPAVMPAAVPADVPPAVPAAVPQAVPQPPPVSGPPPPNGGECVSPGDDCSGPQCCKDPGFQCYMKNNDYGTCRAVCEPGMKEEGEEWRCEPRGQPGPIPEGPEHCAWSGDNCIGLKCCNDANMKCFQKDGYFAGCKFKPVDGWDNTVIGEFRGWHQVWEPKDGPKLGGKLFCFVVKSPNPRVQEDTLIQAAAEKKIGIFSCNENSVFEGAVAAKTDWKSISNTDIFINVWNQVMDEGKFWHNDWTVKADPDCVFFGNRISMHMEKLGIGKDDAVYIKNCNFKFRFQGSLEIFSMKAMERYNKYRQMCSDKIGHEGGEDFFIMTCMDAMGVSAAEDDDVLYDKYATGEHLILDDVSHCSNGWTAAFHPFRTVDIWNNCADAALRAEQT